MALRYRATWHDDLALLLAEARREVALWVDGKTHGALSVPAACSAAAGDNEVSVIDASGEDGAILQVRLDEEQGSDRWTETRDDRQRARPIRYV